MLEFIGWIGAIAFAICGLPQAIASHKQGHSNGISSFFLALWIIGELCTLTYIIPNKQYPLIFNYVFNIIFTLIILWYKLNPRE
jgi:uncharacterized protein with PQ loop repeat